MGLWHYSKRLGVRGLKVLEELRIRHEVIAEDGFGHWMPRAAKFCCL
jgi:hypothetical protein